MRLKHFILLLISFGISLECSAQIDSTFIQGKLQLKDGYYGADRVSSNKPLMLSPNDSSRYYFLTSELLISTRDFAKLEYRDYGDQKVLFVEFEKDKHALWAKVTEEWIHRYLVFVVDNRLIDAREVVASIESGIAAIGGDNWTKEELLALKKAIED